MHALSRYPLLITVTTLLLAVSILAAAHLRAPCATSRRDPLPRAAAASSPRPREPRRIFYRDRVVVLMFHCVSPTIKSSGTITPAAFAADICRLVEDGFRPVSAAQLAAFLDGLGEVPPNAVAITFDDGYAGTYTYAFPVLRRYRVPATTFLIAGYIGRPGFLSWPQVREMEASGLFTFGGHTYDAHHAAPTSARTSAPATVAHVYDPKTGHKETAAEYRARMLGDSLRAQEVFRRELGHTTPYFAYPYGAYTPELDRVLQDAGYHYFFTVLSGVNRKGQGYRVYRVNAGTPWISPDRLVATVRGVACGVRLRAQPRSWSPRWARHAL